MWWMVSPSKKLCVSCVQNYWIRVTSRCVVLPAEGACFSPTCFKSSWGTHFFCVVLAAITSVFLGMRGRILVLCCTMRKAALLLCGGGKGWRAARRCRREECFSTACSAPKLTLVQVDEPAGLCPAVWRAIGLPGFFLHVVTASDSECGAKRCVLLFWVPGRCWLKVKACRARKQMGSDISFSPTGRLLNKLHSLFTFVLYRKSKEWVYSNKSLFGLEINNFYSCDSPNNLIMLYHETS